MLEVIVENVSQHPQVGWAVAGMPKPLTDAVGHLRSKNDDGTFAIARGQELFIATNLQGHERRRITLVAAEDDVPPFQFHHWAVDKPEDLLLAFAVNVDGTEHRARAVVRLESANEARVRFHFATRVHDINIEGWLSMFSAQPWAEFEIRATYGTTATQGLHRVYGSLRMYSGEPMHVDWGVRKGLEPCFELKDGTWETEIAKPGQWMRARTVEVFGAMLFEPDIDAAYEEHVARRDWGPEETASDSFVTPHLADERAGGPICAMLAKEHWRDHWSPTGAVPSGITFPTGAEQRRRMQSMWARLRLPADEYETRPYAQPPNSGQTGEQPDFGCSRGEAVIAMEEPWAIYDLRYSVQAWLLRPYANREPNGAPVQAKDHPEAALYNLRPDERFGRDMLGWPKPVGWISGYTTSDSQHRSDNLLWAMWRLTRSPSLERTIRDIIELERMALRQSGRAPGSGVGAPRGWGRPLLSWAHGAQCGFTEFRGMIDRMVDDMYALADYKLRPEAAQKVLSSREGKYGWNDADGQPIRGVTWWQEAIAVIGLYAAWRVNGNERARELAVTVATSICRHAFWEQRPTDNTGATSAQSIFHHCYITRWLDGRALTDDEYKSPLFAVREGAASYWTAAALRVLLALEPECADAPRAQAILRGYVPNNWDKACWAAIA